MKVRYRANDVVADLPDDAARVLIDAGICDACDERDATLLTPEAPLETTAVTHSKRRR